MRKICPKCGKPLDLSMFYKDRSKPDGLTATCKTCRRKAQKNYRYNNVGSVKKYEDKRRQTEERKNYSKQYQREYRHINKIRVDKYDIRTIARKIINDLVNSNKLKKPIICEVSKKKINVQYHHTNYEKPYIVIALSHKIHEIVHKIDIYTKEQHQIIRKIVTLIGLRREKTLAKYGLNKYLIMFNEGVV